jgi:hypothetical protein
MNVYSRLLQLSDASVSPDGETVCFSIETQDGKKLCVQCPVAELGDIFSFLGQLASAAGERRNIELKGPSDGYNYLCPIPAKGMGFQAANDPNETLLVMRLHGFDLAFSVPTGGLAEVADGFARTARTLSADPVKRN